MAIQPQDWKFLEGLDEKRLLEACCSSMALALERIHFAEVAQETLVRMEGERLRNSLLSAVSHDLRTPLTAIRGLAETLERETDLPEGDRTEVASAIRHQAEGLQRVVTNLLDLNFKPDEEGAGQRPNTAVLMRAGLSVSDLDKIAARLSSADWLELSLVEVGSEPVFEYQSRENDYIPFKNASAGQPATALLKTLLNEVGPKARRSVCDFAHMLEANLVIMYAAGGRSHGLLVVVSGKAREPEDSVMAWRGSRGRHCGAVGGLRLFLPTKKGCGELRTAS